MQLEALREHDCCIPVRYVMCQCLLTVLTRIREIPKSPELTGGLCRLKTYLNLCQRTFGRAPAVFRGAREMVCLKLERAFEGLPTSQGVLRRLEPTSWQYSYSALGFPTGFGGEVA